ncbi:hypothetical protein N7495_007331 [Penicillium taxi]|uniref:uncharacterized protein n=1 Tax=Penicillium taxi TaxID=168475 RepID=UPI0025457E2C|nr:uncharacterized protein N7495_007331 [Penicillium taxi]KAJ5895640.1 hypothetical protein N7495_007331 [Penicillium taxi]
MPRRYGGMGTMFELARLLQVCSLIAIIGMVAKFISLMDGENTKPPSMIVGVMSVACIVCFYCLATVILYFHDSLPSIICTLLDLLMLAGLAVVAVEMARPLWLTSCEALSTLNDGEAIKYAFSIHAGNYTVSVSGGINYKVWITASKSICYETKAIWGIIIALCIFFLITTVTSFFLWRKKKQFRMLYGKNEKYLVEMDIRDYGRRRY